MRFLGVLADSQPIILCLCKRVSRMQGSQVSLTGSHSSVGAQVWKSRDTSQPVKQGLPSPFSPALRYMCHRCSSSRQWAGLSQHSLLTRTESKMSPLAQKQPGLRNGASLTKQSLTKVILGCLRAVDIIMKVCNTSVAQGPKFS